MHNLKDKALQDIAAPEGVCFGCGSKNEHGLQIKSYWDADGEELCSNLVYGKIN